MTAQSARLGDGRLHLNHGPIDLIIEAFGERAEIEAAYDQAWARFPSILPELTAELPVLRRPVGQAMPELAGPVARRMAEAVWPFRGRFITPMAAVAGAVAEEMLAALIAGRRLAKAYVNDGGDIALHLQEGAHLDIGVVRELSVARPEAYVRIATSDPVRGVATSGRQGRSFSLGIADAVTVLAKDAPTADVAATLIANAVDAQDPAIVRKAARELDPDSDLLDLPVTIAVGPLSQATIAKALAAGEARAEALIADGLIAGVLISLRSEWRSLGAARSALSASRRISS